MRASALMTLVSVAALQLMSPKAHAQETFVDRLVLDPEETCAAEIPQDRTLVALALRGAKANNYILAGNTETARLAVRGPVRDAFGVFQFASAAQENALAMYSLGHAKFVQLDDATRLFATSEPSAAVLFQLEPTDGGYFRIKLAQYPFWMRMNVNGYLDFRAGTADAAVEFCAQPVATD